LRQAWLYPHDLIVTRPEIIPGFPDRLLPRDETARALLGARTLTALYNDPPEWLVEVHKELDAAVAAAYGWPAEISEHDAIEAQLRLNQARSAEQKAV
jgi:hypothetical protein